MSCHSTSGHSPQDRDPTQSSRKLQALRIQSECTLEACLQLYKSGWLHTATAVTEMKRSAIEVESSIFQEGDLYG